MSFKYNFTAEIELDVSPAKVFQILEDPLIMSKYVPSVQEVKIVSDIKKGQGVISRWTSQRPDGSIAEWNETVAIAEKDRRMVFKYLELSDTQGEYLLEPTSTNGTKIIFTESMQKLISEEKWHQDHVKEILENIRRAVSAIG